MNSIFLPETNVRILIELKLQAQSYYITKTWDGDAITHHPIQITIGPPDHAARNLKITVTGPFFDDPPNPGGAPGQPFDGLWDYEVAEAFFLNDRDQYVEIELSPHGQHLVLLLKGRRDAFKKLLPLNYTATITGNRWKGVAYIPWEYFPPGVTKFNAYAIHGSGNNRIYESLYPVPKGKYTDPDFHKLDYFQPIDLRHILPSNSNQTYSSDVWKPVLDSVPFGK
ncbi:hypothetical protein FSP39_013292 [Pinctada imbricata]|uniref:Uncharacterized protein n=1 Tax=Pinctada imbricata TaxID=66713 RepID=A0AA88YML1_PINIB|nr:hypothetical protein FSP39_013292 [Pinctada imbricata]